MSFADYRRVLEDDEILLTGAPFYTIQGEGPLGGIPTVFVRLAGCNLGAKEDCPFCDTKFDFDKGRVYKIDDLARRIITAAGGKAEHVVVTGGEPLLQQDAITALINQMVYFGMNFQFQIETNGYFVREDTFTGVSVYAKAPMIVISPKVAATKNAYPKAKDTWFTPKGGRLEYETFLKYVVSSDPESPYHTIPSSVIERCKETGTVLYVSGMAVYLKSYPEGRISSIWHTDEIDFQATGENYRYAAQYALLHGLRLSYQTHLFGAIE